MQIFGLTQQRQSHTLQQLLDQSLEPHQILIDLQIKLVSTSGSNVELFLTEHRSLKS